MSGERGLVLAVVEDGFVEVEDDGRGELIKVLWLFEDLVGTAIGLLGQGGVFDARTDPGDGEILLGEEGEGFHWEYLYINSRSSFCMAATFFGFPLAKAEVTQCSRWPCMTCLPRLRRACWTLEIWTRTSAQ